MHKVEPKTQKKMKMILPVLLAVSVTANAFFAYQLYSRPPAQAVATQVQSPAVIQTDSDCEKIKSLYEQDETKLARLKQTLPIFSVLVGQHVDFVLYGRIPRRYLSELKALDTSKCPMDFQEAWLSYVQEIENNSAQQRRLGGQLFVDLLAGYSIPGIGWEMAGRAASQVTSAPMASNTALDNLQHVLLKYGFHNAI